MVQARLQFAQIESYQPAADYRKTGRIGVVDGRNFAWDAAGVYSAFASRLVAGGASLGANGFEAFEIALADSYHVAVANKVYRFVPSGVGAAVGTWEFVVTLTNVQTALYATIPEHFRGFTSEFMAGMTYVCGWNYGVYKYDSVSDTYTRLTNVTVSGFPADNEPVIAITQTNGRMLYMTETTLYWSGPGDPTDLTPALAGAGFQTIQQHMSGQPRAITPVANGAIVWTTQGAMVAEYVGGQGVFRFYQLSTEVLPISQNTTARLPSNTYIVLTRLGLYAATSNGVPEPVTPLFNEFIRDYMRTRALEVGYIWYTKGDNRLFFSMKSATGAFFETFSLDMSLDKWGKLDDLHLGMFHYAPGDSPLAYMNPQGVVSFLLPDNDPRKSKENPYAPGTFSGLSSEVILGHLRSEELVTAGDYVQELQEAVVYRRTGLFNQFNVRVDEGSIAATITESEDEGSITAGNTISVDEGVIGADKPEIAYGLTILTDLFSPASAEENLNEQEMTLANQGAFADTWVGGLPSFYFRLKFTADNPDEYFKVNAVDCTIAGAGQLV